MTIEEIIEHYSYRLSASESSIHEAENRLSSCLVTQTDDIQVWGAVIESEEIIVRELTNLIETLKGFE